MPQISVIVPVYKVEAYLERCVDSILGQTFSDFELILVDDGSPDNCGTICDGYAEKDSRVHVVHQANGGLSAARNAGIDWVFANSDSQWMTFVDSDDWIHKEYLNTLFQMVLRHKTKLAMCRLTTVTDFVSDEQNTAVDSYILDTRTAYVQQYAMCMSACCKLYHKSIWEQHRFPVGRLYEDAYITHHVLFETDRVAMCSEQLYYYFVNQCSITRARWSKKRLDQIEAHEKRLTCWMERGFQDCYDRELLVYAEALGVQISQILEQKEDISVLHELRSKLCKVLLEKSNTKLFPVSDAWSWLYAAAFPNSIQRKVVCLWLLIRNN